jgi:hypothetical protein
MRAMIELPDFFSLILLMFFHELTLLVAEKDRLRCCQKLPIGKCHGFSWLTLSMSHFTTCTSMNAHATENPATMTRMLKIMYSLHALVHQPVLLRGLEF